MLAWQELFGNEGYGLPADIYSFGILLVRLQGCHAFFLMAQNVHIDFQLAFSLLLGAAAKVCRSHLGPARLRCSVLLTTKMSPDVHKPNATYR